MLDQFNIPQQIKLHCSNHSSMLGNLSSVLMLNLDYTPSENLYGFFLTILNAWASEYQIERERLGFQSMNKELKLRMKEKERKNNLATASWAWDIIRLEIWSTQVTVKWSVYEQKDGGGK